MSVEASGASPTGGTTTAAAVCVTGLERTVDELARRIDPHGPLARGARPSTGAGAFAPPWPAFGSRAVMHEVRLDAIWPWDDAALALCARPDVLVCCRSRAEGGQFRGSEAERCALLARALGQAPGHLDVELGTERVVRERLRRCRPASTRIVVSAHAFEPVSSSSLCSLAEQLAAEEADVLKVAVTVEDAAQVADVLGLLREQARPVVRIAMGSAGVLSRVFPEAFGSPWTYVCVRGAASTAPGQLDWETANAWRLGCVEPLVPVGLLGGPAVLGSPGPWAYNALFARRRWPFRYVPLVSERVTDLLALCERLGFAGLSVTMPAKRAVLTRVDEVEPGAERVGAINTLLWRDGRRVGLNTDVTAVAELLGPGGGRRALVLGAGGAARAAVVGAARAGWSVEVCARDAERAARLASELGVGWSPWTARCDAGFDALVNATPVGANDCANPLGLPTCRGDGRQWLGRVVLDLVLRSEPTELLRCASARGARVVDGLSMWLVQGAAQMSAVTGRPISVADLTEAWDGDAREAWARSVARRACSPSMPLPRAGAVESSPPRDARGDGVPSMATSAQEPPLRMTVPGSKSETQRALVCAALAAGPTVLEAPLDCDDTRALRSALEALGARVRVEGGTWTVHGGRLAAPTGPLWCHDGGTTARFLAPLCLALDGRLVLDASARLRERPMAPVLEALRSLGVVVTALGEPDRLPLALVRAPSRADCSREAAGAQGDTPATPRGSMPEAPAAAMPRVRVDSSESSQFASGLLLAGPVLPAGLVVELLGRAVSLPYLALTIEVMRAFGASVRQRGDGFVVDPSGYRPTVRRIEADWSSAALLLAAGFVAGRRLLLDGLRSDSAQGDRAIVALLDELARPGDHSFDLLQCPDLIAPLAVAAIVSGRRVVLRGTTHARLKECDRPAVLAGELAGVGARIVLRGDALVVEPGSRLRGGELDPHGDHRMAMAFGILSLREPGLRVRNAECVSKSFPGFWEQLERLR